MALLDDLEQELKILKQTRKQSTKEGQPNAKKTYETKVRTEAYRNNSSRQYNERNFRFGTEKNVQRSHGRRIEKIY